MAFQKGNKLGLLRKNITPSKESREKNRLAHLGKHHSEESKRKIGIASKNRFISEETKRKIGLFNKNKIVSLETRKRLSEIFKGKSPSKNAFTKEALNKRVETRRKNNSYIFSEESKRKISNSLKGNHHSMKTREKMSKSRKLDKHPNWKGGLSFEPYSINWNKTLKRAIRERDHYICKVCLKNQDEDTFHVHHIDYDKKNCNPDNLITLCNPCHIKTNFNREYWKEHLKNIINIEYGK